MKLSSETVNVLKNFGTINPGLYFKQGSVLRTIAPSKAIASRAKIKESFPDEFCVADINQFLTVYNLYNDSEIDFSDADIIFKSGKSKIKYRKTAPEMIVIPPEKELNLPSVEVAFTLTEEDHTNIMKTASVLRSPNIAVESIDGQVYITAFDVADTAAHTNSIEVNAPTDADFRFVFLKENLKIIPGSYDVEICEKGIAYFKHKFQEVDYWVAIEQKHSYFKG